ncbi:MAG: M14 family zinc carboxypeptidase [Acidobacteriota bacterium]
MSSDDPTRADVSEDGHDGEHPEIRAPEASPAAAEEVVEEGPLRVPVERLLETSRPMPEGEILGESREGRPIVGYRFGQGEAAISLIGGCHADEPVGPDLLRRLVGWLDSQPESAAVLRHLRWNIVPHVHPDGEERNRSWAQETVAVNDHLGVKGRGYDLPTYLNQVRRDPPGLDLEWGFPTEADDLPAVFAAGADEEGPLGPENLAVARFLAEAAPYRLHISFHSMAFAIGPWFLLDPAWADRTAPLQEALARRSHEMGLSLHDVDRQGEKGFHRIAEGFCTTPNSRAMAAHFIARGDAETAALFRPSSMEFVRSLGGDPLTLVSEMPLFLIPEAPEGEPPNDSEAPPLPSGGTDARLAFFHWAEGFAEDPEGLRQRTADHGWRALALKDQMRLQLELLNEGLRAVLEST